MNEDKSKIDLHKKIWNIFKQFEKDGDGIIRTEDLEALMKTLNIEFAPHKLTRAVKILDPESVGTIEIANFMDYMARCYDDQTERETLKEALKVFENDDAKGCISTNELVKQLLALDDSLSEEEAVELLEEVGISGGYANIDEVLDKVIKELSFS
ncbi:uncharacterized protein [Onthophagus taurus]|uniref:uncharacterized protein n=1 Tax=Onthophagus taurus TaxID=166361 RepID=UPI000C1FE998|nr:calmodulin-like protein 8 [Onthophagus taurus]